MNTETEFITSHITNVNHVAGAWEYTFAEQPSPIAEAITISYNGPLVTVKFRDGRYLSAAIDDHGNIITQTYRLQVRPPGQTAN